MWTWVFRGFRTEVRNSRVKKSCYKTELRKMASHFELLTRKFLYKFFFRVTNSTSQNSRLNFELLARRLKVYFFIFELLTLGWKIKGYTSSYYLMIKLLVFRCRITDSNLKNKKSYLELLTRQVHFYFLTFELRTWSW